MPSWQLRMAVLKIASVGLLVGREDEIERLTADLERALAGNGSLLLVSGEGGIGKTALAEEIAARAEAFGAVTVWGKCLEGEGAPPYWPWSQVLRALPGHESRTEVGESQEARFRFFEWFAAQLRQLGSDRGLLIILDDLHWADEPSLVFLHFLATELARSRVMVIANYRGAELRPDDPLSRALPDLARERSTRHLSLSGLTQAEVAEVLAIMSGKRPTAETISGVFDRTEGNPFFVIEMVRLLGTGAALQQLPESVRQVIRRRLELLSKECLNLLQIASVTGREFDLDLIERVTGVPARELLLVIDEAANAKLLSEVPSSAGVFKFNHALIRETLYEDLPTSRRIDLHHQVGSALETRVASDPDGYLNELAHHFFKASPAADAQKALDYAGRAAHSAMRRGAFEEAVRLYRMALETLSRAGGADRKRAELLLSLARAQDFSGQQVAGLDTSIELARVAARLNDPELLAKAALISEGVFTFGPDVERLEAICMEALAALGGTNSALRARLLAQLSIALHFREGERRELLARESLETAESAADPIAIAAALHAVQLTPWGSHDMEGRLRAGDRLLELGLETHNRQAELWGHYWRVSSFFEMGDMPRLDAEIEAYGRVAEEIKDPSARWRTALSRGARAQMAGQFAEAERCATEVKATGLPTQNRTVQLMRAALMAGVRRAQGQLDEVVELMDEAIMLGPNPTVRSIRMCALAGMGRHDEARSEFNRMVTPDLRAQPRAHTWPITLVHLAETCVALGDRRQAEIMYEMTLPYPERNAVATAGTAAGYGSLSRYLGMLASSLGMLDASVAHYEASIAMNEQQGALPYLAFSECELAETLLARGRPGDKSRAIKLLARSRDTSARLGMRLLQARSSALLAKIQGTKSYAPLTDREAEVAALVAQGLTNKQISERLHLSTRTAENHVENICNKLGFNSRTQIAAWAAGKRLP